MPPNANPNESHKPIAADPPERSEEPADANGPKGIAVCCSGGGIRAAAFSLGGLQALGEDRTLAQVRWLTAVSGGSFIATAYSLVAADLARQPHTPVPPAGSAESDVAVPNPRAAKGERLTHALVRSGERAGRMRNKSAAGDRGIEMGPYALGSPEERHLRADSRYMLPNFEIGLRGAFFLVFGILQNLILLLPIVFVGSHLIGQLLRASGGTALLHGKPLHLGWGPWVALGLVSAAAAVFIADGLVAAYRALPRTFRMISSRLTLWLAVAAAIAAAVLVGLPALLSWLNHTALYDTGWFPHLLHQLGFASPSQCQIIADSGAMHPGAALCQSTTHVVATQPASAPPFTGSTTGNTFAGSGLLAALLALLTRVTIGRTSANAAGKVTVADLEATGRKLIPAKVMTAIRHYLAPWLGSLVVVLVFVVLALRWSLDGATRDLAAELAPILIAAAIGVLAKLVISVNRTSMHRFYRERLASAYGITRRGFLVDQPNASDSTDVMPADPAVLMSSLDPAVVSGDLPVGYGCPELVICAAANVTGSGVPTGRGAMSFTFTPGSSGLATGRQALDAPAQDSRGRARRAPTDSYERYCGPHVFGLFDMVAMSGAALSPLMGKLTRPSLRILMAMANVRLGVWLPNPGVITKAAPMTESAGQRRARNTASRLAKRPTWWRRVVLNLWQPGALALLKEMHGACRIDGRWLYVTDGGGFENLGIVEALRRRPAEVICFDAAGDTPGSFSSLGQAIALARTDLGIEIRIDPAADGEGAAAVPYLIGSAIYPDGETAQIWYAKAMMSPGAPWDVQAYAKGHPTFPHDSTGQQLYGEPEFEAYRCLGQDAVGRLLRARLSGSTAAPEAATAASSEVDLTVPQRNRPNTPLARMG